MSVTVTINPALRERWPTLREYVAFVAQTTAKPGKVQAADMDLAPSTLSRKLNPTEGDTQRLNIDDLEHWLASTGEAERIVEYLASKYLDSDDARRARVLAQAESLLGQLAKVLPALQESAT